ncbi:MAG: M1 family metallopeptidase [Myxococcales bacterium]|nr:M1 family metallopeptidase [Myxococcales bacterium]
MRPDPHSYADTGQPQTSSISFDLHVDFELKTLSGEIELRFREPGSGPLDLDTNGLRIAALTSLAGAALKFELARPEPILGARLRIDLPAQTRGVRIRYATSPGASALQWLGPAQTSSGQPFLFSQCQPIHARSVFPLQDSPRVRVTVDSARFTVPPRLRTLMAASFRGRQGPATDVFAMPQPIPPYLLAFAVGDLTSRELSRRSAVWAEPAVADAAAFEFAGVEQMIVAAEKLFGPYEWERYDVLVMPPSFPFGGMENPRLTFVTPSVLAGDRSLVNVIAHELAHAWTGNLITNASLNDFWLNEGFTVYAERRILEALEGRELSELHAAIGRHDLDVALERFRTRPELTRLRTDLAGIDPDEAYSTLPYEKGYLFLRRLEELAGRAAWDGFLRAYMTAFRFQSIDTAQFLGLLDRELPGLSQKARALEWIDQPGIPADAPQPRSRRLEELRSVELPPADVSPTELLVHLQAVRSPTERVLRELDARFGLSSRKSLELRHTFVLLQLRAGLAEGIDGARRVVRETGRMKYLRPVYQELAKTDRAVARRTFDELRESYHPIARAVVEGLLK